MFLSVYLFAQTIDPPLSSPRPCARARARACVCVCVCVCVVCVCVCVCVFYLIQCILALCMKITTPDLCRQCTREQRMFEHGGRWTSGFLQPSVSGTRPSSTSPLQFSLLLKTSSAVCWRPLCLLSISIFWITRAAVIRRMGTSGRHDVRRIIIPSVNSSVQTTIHYCT